MLASISQFFLVYNLNALYFLFFLIKHNFAVIFALVFIVILGYLEYQINTYKYVDDRRLMS